MRSNLLRAAGKLLAVAGALAWIVWIVSLVPALPSVHAQVPGSRLGFAHQVWSVGSGGTTTPTVPAGTNFCTFAVTANAINYFPDTSAPAPSTVSGIPANVGSIFQMDNYFNCVNLTAIAQTGTATVYVEYWR